MFKFFIIGIIILVVILAFLFLPETRITLNLNSEPFTHNLEVRIDAELEKVLPQLDAIPANLLEISGGIEKTEIPQGFLTNEDLRDAQRGEILVFKQADLLTLIDIKIKPILEELGKVEKAGETQITWQVKELNLAGKYAKLKIHLKKTVYSKLDIEEIKENLTGRTKEEIEEYCQGLPGFQGVEVRFRPSFLKKAPIRTKGIDIFLNIF